MCGVCPSSTVRPDDRPPLRSIAIGSRTLGLCSFRRSKLLSPNYIYFTHFFDFTYGIFIVQARHGLLHADGTAGWYNGSIDDVT